MNKTDVEKALLETFEDYRLSKNEKYALAKVFKDFDHNTEMLRYTRNRAFEIVKKQIRDSDQYQYESIKWLEQIIKTLDVSQPTSQESGKVEAYFSPGETCAKQIISLIRSAKKSIDICVFTISDDSISREIVKAHQRKIPVRIITDDDKANDLGSDIGLFIKKGIDVKMDNSPSHMHHKFAIFDEKTLVNGSFNWTRSASRYNQENVVVMSNPNLVKTFLNTFENLWKTCVHPSQVSAHPYY